MTNILQEAEGLINGQRRQDYGGVTESFTVIAGLWAAYLGHEVTNHDVANLMVLLKVARARNGYHRDSYVDVIGYAALTEKLDEEAAATPVSQEFWDDIDRAAADLSEKIEEHTGRFLLYNPEPRVWESLNDVPVGVQVTDIDGDEWLGDGNEEDDVWVDKYAPFTEVLS